jgi:hypothetical protein
MFPRFSSECVVSLSYIILFVPFSRDKFLVFFGNMCWPPYTCLKIEPGDVFYLESFLSPCNLFKILFACG